MPVETVVKKRKSIWCAKPSTLPVKSVELPKWGLTILIRKNIDEIADTWNRLTPDESFAQSAYLKTLELTNPNHLNNLYVLVFKDDKPIGAVLLQSLILRLNESFDYDNYTTDRSNWSRMWQRFRQLAISWITFRMMTVGNLYLTGQYGIHFKDERYSQEDQFGIVQDLMKVLRKELCSTEYRFSGILYKDFFEEDGPEDPKKLSLTKFQIDPNMILKMRPSWLTFDDYLLDMRSKYRVRMKNAMKRFGKIQRRTLDLPDIEVHNDKMYQLYNKILEGSGFVLAMGNENYFTELKRQLGDELNVIGYFKDDELVGFYTWVLEGEKMDSHFIGFEPGLNNRHQIYLNILLDLVKDGINNRARSIYYFRTALEIKSSVGSEPIDMNCYFRHTNGLLNRLVVPTAFKYFVPHQTWRQRHPFKSLEHLRQA